MDVVNVQLFGIFLTSFTCINASFDNGNYTSADSVVSQTPLWFPVGMPSHLVNPAQPPTTLSLKHKGANTVTARQQTIWTNRSQIGENIQQSSERYRSLDEVMVLKSVTCLQSIIRFYLKFKEPFYGIIYSERQYPRCVYVKGYETSRTEYEIAIPQHACGTVVTSESIANTIIIQRDPEILKSTDLSFTVSCDNRNVTGFPLSGHPVQFKSDEIYRNRMVTNSFSVLNRPKVVPVRGKGEEFQPFLYWSKLVRNDDLNGLPVDGIVELGEKLTFAIACEDRLSVDELGKVYAKDAPGSQAEENDRNQTNSCKIGSCWARDGNDTIVVQLSDDNGCSLYPDFWGNFASTHTTFDLHRATVLKSDIYAWCFPTDSHVIIRCDIEFCEGRNPATCKSRTHECSSSPRPQGTQRPKLPPGTGKLDQSPPAPHGRMLADDPMMDVESNKNRNAEEPKKFQTFNAFNILLPESLHNGTSSRPYSKVITKQNYERLLDDETKVSTNETSALLATYSRSLALAVSILTSLLFSVCILCGLLVRNLYKRLRFI